MQYIGRPCYSSLYLFDSSHSCRSNLRPRYSSAPTESLAKVDDGVKNLRWHLAHEAIAPTVPTYRTMTKPRSLRQPGVVVGEGTNEIQTASQVGGMVPRLEIESLICSLCTLRNGPLGTSERWDEEKAAENCWLTLHIPTLHEQDHHTLLFSATKNKL
jgi:hypothetical protein